MGNFNLEKPIPGKPVAAPMMEARLSKPEQLIGRLFKLRYIRFREMETTLLLFRAETDIVSAVSRAKEWCSTENVRFIHLDRAIQEME